MTRFQPITLITNVLGRYHAVETAVRIVPDAAASSLPFRGYSDPRQSVTRSTGWTARITGQFESAAQAEDFVHHIADRSGIAEGRLVSQAAGCIDMPPPTNQEPITHE